MAEATAEEIKESIKSMKELGREARKDPELRRRIFEAMKINPMAEVPKLTPRERGDLLLERLGEK